MKKFDASILEATVSLYQNDVHKGDVSVANAVLDCATVVQIAPDLAPSSIVAAALIVAAAITGETFETSDGLSIRPAAKDATPDAN